MTACTDRRILFLSLFTRLLIATFFPLVSLGAELGSLVYHLSTRSLPTQPPPTMYPSRYPVVPWSSLLYLVPVLYTSMYTSARTQWTDD